MTRPALVRGPSGNDVKSWRDARRLADESGWNLIGTGDWAWAYGSPDGELAWRITPFDPAFDYFAEVCDTNPNPHLPRIVSRNDHPQGGSSVLMDRLDEVPKRVATKWVTSFDEEPDTATTAMLKVLRTAVGECTLPLFVGLDMNPGNVRRRPATNQLVLIDAFWINGKALYEMVVTHPQQAVDLFGHRELVDWVYIPAMDAGGRSQAIRALASL